LLEALSIGVQVSGKRLVQGVSVEVPPGHLLAVVGPNGAGKSTLLRVLSGEHPPTKGQICLNGTELHRWSAKQLAQMRAVLPQNSSLSFPFRVLDVVLIGRTPHLRSAESSHDYAIVDQALQAVDMSEFGRRPYTTLSGGEKQRLQLARVLAQIWEESSLGPRYLFLDEPTNNLDIAHQHRMMRVARDLKDQGVGILAVLHDLNLAAQYADTIMLMQNGQVSANGFPSDVLTPDRIKEVFMIPVRVIKHPTALCPVIVPVP